MSIEYILQRRSVRNFTEEIPANEDIAQILKAGMHAPSAMNQRPWHFIVTKDQELRNQCAQKHLYGKMISKAPILLTVCGQTTNLKFPHYWDIDCAIACQNILLAVHTLGLGAVYIGVYPEEEHIADARSILSIPKEIVPFAYIPIGYPTKIPTPKDVWLEDRIHTEQW